MSSELEIKNPFAGRRVILAHHWPFSVQRQPVFSENTLYLTVFDDKHPAVHTVADGAVFDMARLAEEFKEKNRTPDLFVAKVDAFFRVVPINVAAFKCPKVLILGDTHHGKEPLKKMIRYTKDEKYDFYITDHNRHHLWFYYLAGIKKSYWLPGIFLNSPAPGFEHQPFLSQNISAESLKEKALFVGQAKKFHRRRIRLLKHALNKIPYFKAGTMVHADSLKGYYHALLSLNISLNGDLNLRCMEIASAGGLQLSDKLSDEAGLGSLFEEDKEIILYNNQDEMIDKINHYHDDQYFSMNVRTKSYKRYKNEYSPEKFLARLDDIIEGRDVEDRFVSNSLPRIKYIQQASYSPERIESYELTQELHRSKESVRILIDGRIDFAFPEDLLDLPRVEVFLINQNPETLERLKKYIDYAPDAQRLKVVKEISSSETFDLVFVPSLELSMRDTLRDDQSYMIYRGSRWDSTNDPALKKTRKPDM